MIEYVVLVFRKYSGDEICKTCFSNYEQADRNCLFFHGDRLGTGDPDVCGWQFEEEDPWDIAKSVKELSPRVTVRIDGRDVHIRCWLYEIKGVSGEVIPVHLLDTDLEENSEWDRRLIDRLYLGDHYMRLCQEVVLGQAGAGDERALYDKQQKEIIPMYRDDRSKFIGIMRHSIALNGSFFNTQRMLLQYLARAYFS